MTIIPIPKAADPKIFVAILAKCKADHPSFTFMPKDRSRLMRAIGYFSPRFLHSFATTLGTTTMMPQHDIDESEWPTLAHETVHVDDEQAQPVLYNLTYVLPQALVLLAPLALLAINHSLWFLLFALALACIFMPSPGRKHWERRGYQMSIICDAMRFGEKYVVDVGYIAMRVKEYTGGAYLWMDPFPASVEQEVRSDIRRALALVKGEQTDAYYSTRIDHIRAAAAA